MSYTEEIIKDSYSRFENKDWAGIASTRIEEAYKKKGENPIGEITYHNLNSSAISFIVKAILAAIILISILTL